MAMVLPDPPFYFPLRHGRYDVAPGLTKLGKDHGGGGADAHVFQIDKAFKHFHSVKRASRLRNGERHVVAHDLTRSVLSEVVGFIVDRLVAEHPAHFRLQRMPTGTSILHCGLTRDVIPFGQGMRLAVAFHHWDALDALACQVQEDLAVLSASPEGTHWLSAAHVCLPNGWAPEQKIGKSFAQVHEPVAGMQDMNRRGEEFANIMLNATDGLVRFAWGLTFDDKLNHHPRLQRAPFDPRNPRVFLRVERQTMWGFPRVRAALFTIRTYLYDCDALRRDPATRDPLLSVLRTMPVESQRYKGIAPYADDLLAWLTSP